MRLVSVILPTYNEAENIIPLIKAIQKEIRIPKEIIVVDDNSPDGTSKLVQKYQAKFNNNVHLITRYKNRGLTNSIRDGIKSSKGDVVVWMDCDFSHPPILINKLLEKINEGHDIAVASRFIKNGGFKQEKGENILAIGLSKAMNYTIQFLLGRHFGDYTSGFVATKKNVFRKIKLRGDYGEYFIDFIYKAFAYKYKVIEIPFINLPRTKGKSKTGNNLYEYLMRGRKYMLLSFQLLIEKHLLKKIP